MPFTKKKHEELLINARGPYAWLRRAVNDKGDGTRIEQTIAGIIWYRDKETREAFIKSGFFPYPKEYEKYFLADLDYTGAEYEGVCQFTAYDEETYALADMAGLCWYWLLFYFRPPIKNRAMIADLISCVTGMDIDEAEATKLGRRLVNLVRAYNVREGIRRKDDTVHEVFFQITPPAPYEKLSRDKLNKWIDRWYELKGWDNEGIPTKETLEQSGLDYVRQDLEQRGVLPE